MKTLRSVLGVLLIAILILGCEEQDLASFDPGGNAPVLTDGLISPDTINVDTLTPSDGLYPLTLSVTVKAVDPDGDLETVIARVLRRNGSGTLVETRLVDNGTGGDLTPGDSVYSGVLNFSIQRADAGFYAIEFLSSDEGSRLSNLLGRAFLASRSNSAPTLDTGSLIAPDSVSRPATGSSLVFMSIAAADSDGLADVRNVFFINLASQSQTPQFLLDDGGVPQPGGVTSGDLLAGDGVFSIVIQVPSTIPLGVYPFSFQAEDTFGDSSAAFIHNLTIN
ncbi:MAG: hypothetical protein OEV30_07630 [Ignavibacteria bacterium]|nr:hypothetical protein [Ignavibacteria bacterium]